MYHHNSGREDARNEANAQQPNYSNYQWTGSFPLSTGANASPGYTQHTATNAYAMPVVTPFPHPYAPSQGSTHVPTQQLGSQAPLDFHVQGNSAMLNSNFYYPPRVEQGSAQFEFTHQTMDAIPLLYYRGQNPLLIPPPSSSYPASVSYPPTTVLPRRSHDLNSRRVSYPPEFFTRITGAVNDEPMRHQPQITPQAISRSPVPPPLDNSPYGSPSIGIIIESPNPVNGRDFIKESFPAPTAEDERLRVALAKVMSSDWKLAHSMEPNEELLLQFTSYNKKYGRWGCRFSKDGKPCVCSTRKKDHAKGHIRWHIDHRPFFCEYPCPTGDQNCNKQYTAMESLKKHQTGKAQCSLCGAYMLKGNLQRHRLSSCKGPQSNEDAMVSS